MRSKIREEGKWYGDGRGRSLESEDLEGMTPLSPPFPPLSFPSHHSPFSTPPLSSLSFLYPLLSLAPCFSFPLLNLFNTSVRQVAKGSYNAPSSFLPSSLPSSSPAIWESVSGPGKVATLVLSHGSGRLMISMI